MKMKHLQSAALVAIAALALTACSDDNPWAGVAGKGGITLRLKTDAEVRQAAPTRATETLADVPTPDQFVIKMTTPSGDTRKWDSLADFEKEAEEKGFNVGTYTLRAEYGDVYTEGFKCAAFGGEQKVNILEGEQTKVEISTALESAMVSVTATDALTKFFPEYSMTVNGVHTLKQTVTSDKIGLPDGSVEAEPLFFTPGHVSFVLNLHREIAGQNYTANLKVADFDASAKTHYHVNLDYNGGKVGDGVFTLTFIDDMGEPVEVEVDLTDELFTSPAPVLTAVGFGAENVDMLQAVGADAPLQIKVNASADIQEAILTVEGSSVPAWGQQIDLCKANETQQDQLKNAGFECVGFFKNPSRFARIDFTTLNLPLGTYKISLAVTDTHGHISSTAEGENPVATVTITEATIEVETKQQPQLDDSKLNLTVEIGGGDINLVTFEALDEDGNFRNCEYTWSEATRSRAIETKTYNVVVTLPVACFRPVLKLNMYYDREHNPNPKHTYEIPVNVPEYSVSTVDAFARYAIIKVTPTDAADLSRIVNNIEISLNDGSSLSEANLVRNSSTGEISILNLSGNTKYEVSTSLSKYTPEHNTCSFTTEAENQLPNSDFSATRQTINITSIATGGPYKYLLSTYQNHSSISVSEPTGWSSINSETCYSGSSTMNTWFCVPSTIWEKVEDRNSVRIRSVAYSHSGTAPSLDDHKTSVIDKFCRNVPGLFSNYAAGELFYDNSFGSRPTSLTFSYSYKSENGESAQAAISLLDNSGNVVGSGVLNLSAASDEKTQTVSVNYNQIGKKASKILVKFKSSTAAKPVAPVPSDLNDVGTTVPKSGGYTIDANKYKALCTGSELTIYSVSLGYDYPGKTAANRPAAKTSVKRTTRK